MLELSEVLGGEALQFLVEGEEDGDPDDWDPKARSSIYMVTCYEPKETETDKMRPSTLTRQAFADLIIEAYKETNPMRQVVRWCVVLEWGARQHFHMALNTDGPVRFLGIVDWLRKKKNLYVNFRSHSCYARALLYNIRPTKHKPYSKLDKTPLFSPNHKPLDEAVKIPLKSIAATAKSVLKSQQKRKAADAAGDAKKSKTELADEEKEKKKRRIPPEAKVALAVRVGFVKTGDDLTRYAEEQMLNYDDYSLTKYLAGKSADKLVKDELYKMKASERIERKKLTKIQILELALEDDCVCGAEWIPSMWNLCTRSNEDPMRLGAAIYDALYRGAGKGRAVLLHGCTTSGKSWIFDPLGLIFFAHDTPDLLGTQKPLLGFQKFEIALWQEFRWEEKGSLSWANFFRLLGGENLTIGEALNQASEHTPIKVYQPMFMSSNVIPGFERQANNQVELDALLRRYNKFLFNGTISKEEVRNVPACKCCFAKWVLSCGDLCKAMIKKQEEAANNAAKYEIPPPAAQEAQLKSMSDAAIARLQTCGPCLPKTEAQLKSMSDAAIARLQNYK